MRIQPFPRWPVAGPEDRDALARVLDSDKWGSGMYFGMEAGSQVNHFEHRFADYQGGRYGVAVANGTAALEIILRALGVLPGDEVIVPAFTFIATASAVLQMGAVPVFVDVLQDTFNIDPDAVERAVTPRTRAVIGVHWGGQPCDIDRLSAISANGGLAFVEDACQAHGAEWKGCRVGAFGAAGSFSFQGTKNLTCGEGGFVLTNNEDLYERCYGLHTIGRRHGRGNYEHFDVGWNYRLTEFQGALLNVQLDRLEEQTQRRQVRVQRLIEKLSDVPGLRVQSLDPSATRSAWYNVIVEITAGAFAGVGRNKVAEALRAEGIPAGTPYHYALHRNPVFTEKNFPWVPGRERLDFSTVECPVSDRLASNTIFLPQYLLLGSEQDVDDVVTAIAKVERHAKDL